MHETAATTRGFGRQRPAGRSPRGRGGPFADTAQQRRFWPAAPHDVKRLAAELGEVLGDRRVCAVREMTKLHESVVWSSLLSFECEERGEIVLVIEGAEEENALLALSPEEHLAAYISSGMDKKEAVKRVAAERGVPKNDIYKLTL